MCFDRFSSLFLNTKLQLKVTAFLLSGTIPAPFHICFLSSITETIPTFQETALLITIPTPLVQCCPLQKLFLFSRIVETGPTVTWPLLLQSLLFSQLFVNTYCALIRQHIMITKSSQSTFFVISTLLVSVSLASWTLPIIFIIFCVFSTQYVLLAFYLYSLLTWSLTVIPT